MKYKVAITDNFGGDYPDEKFLQTPPMDKEDAESVAKVINKAAGEDHPRYWKVVEVGYKLQPGFEP